LSVFVNNKFVGFRIISSISVLLYITYIHKILS
jgi:hypothetical protein